MLAAFSPSLTLAERDGGVHEDVFWAYRRTTCLVIKVTVLYANLAFVTLVDEQRNCVHSISYFQSHPKLLVGLCDGTLLVSR
jgi:hypothetical protein